MQHAVEGRIGAVVSFNVVVLLPPAQLHIIEDAGGDDELLFFEVGKLAAGHALAIPIAIAERHYSRLFPKFGLG